jgi:hypothetical protein
MRDSIILNWIDDAWHCHFTLNSWLVSRDTFTLNCPFQRPTCRQIYCSLDLRLHLSGHYREKSSTAFGGMWCIVVKANSSSSEYQKIFKNKKKTKSVSGLFTNGNLSEEKKLDTNNSQKCSIHFEKYDKFANSLHYVYSQPVLPSQRCKQFKSQSFRVVPVPCLNLSSCILTLFRFINYIKHNWKTVLASYFTI